MYSFVKPLYRDLKRNIRAYGEYFRQYSANKDRNIRFYNWWSEPYETLWWYQFVRNLNIMPNDKVINFCSVFGPREIVNYINDGSIIFYTGENVHDTDHIVYGDHLLASKKTSLAMGFDSFEAPKYLRFPLWIPYLFPPTLDEKVIRKRCEELRYPKLGDRNKFASLVCRYDWRGTRTEIYDAIKHIGDICCPSVVNHNDDDLHLKYNDNKIEYLKQFKFNICPENTNSYGYVTEKVFEAIIAGCVPIYWGSNNNPEPSILNHDAIIFWNMGGDNSKSTEMIKDLQRKPTLFSDFFYQPRLLPKSENMICEKLDLIKDLIKQLL